MPLNIENIYS